MFIDMSMLITVMSDIIIVYRKLMLVRKHLFMSKEIYFLHLFLSPPLVYLSPCVHDLRVIVQLPETYKSSCIVVSFSSTSKLFQLILR